MNPPDDDAALLARAAATWLAMRYLADAHIGVGMAFDRERGMMVERVTVVVEVKGDYP